MDGEVTHQLIERTPAPWIQSCLNSYCANLAQLENPHKQLRLKLVGKTGQNQTMRQEWFYNGKNYSAKVPANIRPFVVALGADLAVELFLQLGGTEVRIEGDPQSETSNKIVRIIGLDAFYALRDQWAIHEEKPKRTPLANAFIIRHLRSKGASVASIAAKVRCSDVAVRHALKNETGQRSFPALDKFDD